MADSAGPSAAQDPQPKGGAWSSRHRRWLSLDEMWPAERRRRERKMAQEQARAAHQGEQGTMLDPVFGRPNVRRLQPKGDDHG